MQKSTSQYQISIPNKKSQQTKNRRTLAQLDKTYVKIIVNITLNSKRLNTFSLRSKTRQRCSL